MTHFTEAILAASKARAAPLCWYNKRRATRLAAKSARPSGWGVSGRRGRCGACPMHASRPLRTAPTRATRFAPMKCVIISDLWYKVRRLNLAVPKRARLYTDPD
jgi:hypothetical protein